MKIISLEDLDIAGIPIITILLIIPYMLIMIPIHILLFLMGFKICDTCNRIRWHTNVYEDGCECLHCKDNFDCWDDYMKKICP